MSDQSRRVRRVQTGDGGIVMDIDNGKMFSLNASGSVIFELLSSGLDDSSIVAELVRRFEIAPDVAKKDLGDFREALRQVSLLPEDARACAG
jgi:hypothetical protein